MTRCEVEVHVWATKKRRDDEGVTGFGREQQELFVRSPRDSVNHYYFQLDLKEDYPAKELWSSWT